MTRSPAPYAGARILGGGESDVGRRTGRSTLDHQMEAIERALSHAGVELDAIDGVAVSKGGELRRGDLPAVQLSELLGLRPQFVDTTLAGGAGPIMQVARAAAAVTAGLCSHALVVYGSTQSTQRTRRTQGWAADPASNLVQFEQPTGYRHPASVHALIAARHMHDHGTTSGQLAMVAVSGRRWAQLNPAACARDPLTVEDVLASPVISSPLHALDCCLVTDGAGAVVVGPARGERDVRIVGYSERHSHQTIVHAADLTTSDAVVTGAEALAMAGLRPGDIDVVELYDAFTDMPIVLLEDLGFCGKGEGGPFVESGATSPGGRLPMNTQGGGLSHCHPGQYGIFMVIEALHQLEGSSGPRTVPGAQHVLCHGVGGGGFGSHATMVLGVGS